MAEIKVIPLRDIEVGENEQRLEVEDDTLDELAASIRRVGLINPLSVSCRGDKFVIVSGHRRYRACLRAGLAEIRVRLVGDKPAVVKEVSFAENLFRKDLSPLELACAIEDCITNKIMTIEQLAGSLHRSEHWIHCQLALLKWPTDVLQEVHTHSLSVAAAANLAMVDNDVYRGFLLRNAVESGATARTTAAWLQAWRSMEPPEMAVQAEPEPGKPVAQPMVPQAPCICCSQVFRTDELSHVPVCTGCIRVIRDIGQSR